MRKILISFAVVLIAVGATGAPATAASSPALNRQVSGPFKGTSDFNGSADCSFVKQVYDATYQPTDRRDDHDKKHPRSGFFHLTGCVEFTGGDFTYSGSFVLTTPNRAVLRGTVSGNVGNSSVPCPAGFFSASLDLRLSVTSGTRGFRDATGDIRLTGGWCSTGFPGRPGPIGGYLTGGLTSTL